LGKPLIEPPDWVPSLPTLKPRMKIWDRPGPEDAAVTLGKYLMRLSKVVTFSCARDLAGERLDRDRHVLHVLAAALRGHRNFLNLVGGRTLIRRIGRAYMTDGTAAENGGNRTRKLGT
jgi:hypothetical protein